MLPYSNEYYYLLRRLDLYTLGETLGEHYKSRKLAQKRLASSVSTTMSDSLYMLNKYSINEVPKSMAWKMRAVGYQERKKST